MRFYSGALLYSTVATTNKHSPYERSNQTDATALDWNIFKVTIGNLKPLTDSWIEYMTCLFLMGEKKNNNSLPAALHSMLSVDSYADVSFAMPLITDFKFALVNHQPNRARHLKTKQMIGGLGTFVNMQEALS